MEARKVHRWRSGHEIARGIICRLRLRLHFLAWCSGCVAWELDYEIYGLVHYEECAAGAERLSASMPYGSLSLFKAHSKEYVVTARVFWKHKNDLIWYHEY